MSNCQVEVELHVKDLTPLPPTATIAPLVVASFDCEMFSYDGTFPTPHKGDFTCALCVSFWAYGTPIESAKRVALLVGDADARLPPTTPAGVLVQRFATPKALVEGFRDLVVFVDPDVGPLGWNNYGFDFPFLADEYTLPFTRPEQRGSESLQVALRAWLASQRPAAASAAGVGVEASSVASSGGAAWKPVGELLADLGRQRGAGVAREWADAASRKWGGRYSKLAAAQAVTAAKRQHANSGSTVSLRHLAQHTSGTSDDDGDEGGGTDLPERVAVQMRGQLRAKLGLPLEAMLSEGTALRWAVEHGATRGVRGDAGGSVLWRLPAAPWPVHGPPGCGALPPG